MDAPLRAGLAIYTAGRYHAAHDAWEEVWLDLDDGPDERLLHGLIQFTAVVYHLTEGNHSGAKGLAESAGTYLGDLQSDYRGLNIDEIRPALDRIAADPAALDPADPPELTHHGERVTYDDLDFDATGIVARVLAEADGYDEEMIDGAIEYARRELDDTGGDRFVGLLFAFVRQSDKRPVIADRLRAHVEREQGKDDDVAGLFG
jgi:hypothetical protein